MEKSFFMLIEIFRREVTGKVKWMKDAVCAKMVEKVRPSSGLG